MLVAGTPAESVAELNSASAMACDYAAIVLTPSPDLAAELEFGSGARHLVTEVGTW